MFKLLVLLFVIRYWFKRSAANIFYWWISVAIIVGGRYTFFNNYSVSTMKCDVYMDSIL